MQCIVIYFKDNFVSGEMHATKKIIAHLYIQLEKPIFIIYIGDLSALSTYSDNSNGRLIPTEYWHFSWKALDITVSIIFWVSKIKINVCV